MCKADGTESTIAQLQAGDHVLADGNGRVLQVQRIITGEESKAMWRLRAGACEVLATHDHPVMTANGPVAIAQLQVGDVVRSVDGLIAVDSISEETYQGQVVNLVLQALDGTISLQGDHFIGGGFLIGDNTMQNALAAKQDMPELPPEWQLDAYNASCLMMGKELVLAA